MLLRLFKGTGPGVLFLIIITLSALWMSAFLNPRIDSSFIYETDPMPLYGLLKIVIGSKPLLCVFFSFAMVSLIAFLLVNFNTRVFFINERTFLPALIYILCSGFFPQFQILNPVLPASLFLMFAIRRIIDSYREQGTAYNFFDAGILLSTGSLFYGNLAWFGLLVIIGIAIFRTISLTEIAISLLGLVTPYVITFGLYYVAGKDLEALLQLITNNLFTKTVPFMFSRITIAAMVYFGFIILVSLFYLLTLISTKKIKSRKTFNLFIWVFLISGAGYLLLPSVSVEIVWIISIPVSYFLAHYFVFVRKKLVSEIFFSVLLLLIILMQVWYIK
jgi:hypothetical protein